VNPSILNPWLQKHPGPFRVGDRVSYLDLDRRREGVVLEDRGPLGVGGRRLYSVRVRVDDWNEITTELPAEELELVAQAPAPVGSGRSG
jgi:hypothetical protein